MSKQENINLRLGDIIRFESPSNSNLNERSFIIDYIDNKQIIVLNEDDEYSLGIEDGILTDKSIVKIFLIYRSEKEGFIKQNNLDVNMWLDLHFGGDMPMIFTGKVTNIENDMIEVTNHPNNEKVIYINFNYQGIPRDINLNKIIIREAPIKASADSAKEEGEENIDDDYDDFIDEEINDITDVEIGEALTNLDTFVLGEELETIKQFEKVRGIEKRYGLDLQEKDILDDIISKIPERERRSNINLIQKMIESYKILRSQNSNFDEDGNVISLLKKGSDYKPLVQSLLKMEKELNYFIPILKSSKVVYDVNATLVDDRIDVIQEKYNKDIEKYDEIFQKFSNGVSTMTGDNYSELIIDINNYFKPFYPISDNETFSVNTSTDIDCLISNYDDFNSTTFGNNDIYDKKFLKHRYTSDVFKKKLQEDVFKNDQKIELKKVLDGENLSIKSFLVLPKKDIFNAFNLNTLNLLERIKKFNMSQVSYMSAINKNTKINEIVINSFEDKIKYSFDDTNMFSLSDVISVNTTMEKDLYEKFLNLIVPKTIDIIKGFEEDIEKFLSFQSITKVLSPFLVEHDSLTFKQYEEIIKIIENNRKLYVKRIKKVHDSFFDYRNRIKNGKNELYGYKEEQNKYLLPYRMKYIGETEEIFGESEIISNSLNYDFGNVIISSLIDKELLSEENTKTLMEYFNKKYSKSKKDTECDNTVVVAKKYRKLTHLEDDNGTQIYFDKEFDDTVYELLTIYEKEKSNLSSSEFQSFLRGKLMKVDGMSEDYADYMVESIIENRKKVKEGQYGLLESFLEGEEGVEGMYYNYYRRENDNWVYDNIVTDRNKFKMLLPETCNIKNGCVDDNDLQVDMKDISRRVRKEENCINKDELLINIKRKIMKKMISEFDYTYDYSVEQMKKFIDHAITSSELELFDKIVNMRNEKLKYNNFMYQLSLSNPIELDKPISPKQGLLNKILGLEDKTKQSNYILEFCKNFTRDYVNEEDSHWKYCNETGVQLLPIFRFELAEAYIKDTSFYKEHYINTLNRIRNEEGTLSEDGDKYISKYGGWEIIKVEDFRGDEYDGATGYKISNERVEVDTSEASESIIEEVSELIEKKKDIFEFKQLYLNSNSKKIYELIGIFINELGTNLNQETVNFIIKVVNKSYDINFYNETLGETQSNKVLLILTISTVLLAIQMKASDVTTTKTVKSCKSSFVGYPLYPEGGIDGLEFVSCVAYSLRTKTSSLFKLFKKVKQENIKDAIIDYTNNYILVLPEIAILINEIKSTPTRDTDSKLRVDKKWNNFLPPIFAFTIKTEKNVSSEFINDQLSLMKKADVKFLYNLNVLKGKMIKIAFNILYDIKKVISKKELLLKNMKGESFLENACCNNENEMSPLEYFNNEDNSILNYHDMLVFNSNILETTKRILRPKMIISNLIRKPINVLENTNTINESNIYLSIIHYCKLGDLNKSKRYSLRNVCSDVEVEFTSKDTLNDKIEKLKSKGYNFNQLNLNELMSIVNSENKVKRFVPEVNVSDSQKIIAILEEDSLFKDNSLDKKVYDILDEYNSNSNVKGVEESNIELQNYLFDEINTLKGKLFTFFDNNISFSAKDKEIIDNFLDNIVSFDKLELSDDNNYHRNINYLVNLIYEFSVLNTTIVSNKHDLSDYKNPNTWKNLSNFHKKKVNEMISSFYLDYKKFFGKEDLNTCLHKMSDKLKKYYDIAKIIPVYNNILTKDKIIEPLLHYKTVLYLMKYLFLKTNELYIDTCYEVENGIIEEDRSVLRNDIGMFLFVMYNKNSKSISVSNMSYEYIMKKVKSSQEKEKRTITDELKNLSEEEVEVERFKKKYKNDGRWTTGAKKDLITYSASAYDIETSGINDINVHLMSEVNEFNDITMLGEDYHDGIDPLGASED
jgi:hypothetical protein